MICMKSRAGVRIWLNRLDRPAQIPIGMPTASETMTAAMVSARVSIAGCHRPCRPMNTKPAHESTATFQVPYAADAKVIRAITPSQPISGSGRPLAGCESNSCIHVTKVSAALRISLKKYTNTGLLLRFAPTDAFRSFSR